MDLTLYVQKHVAVLAMCHNPALVRDKPLGVPASVNLVYYLFIPKLQWYNRSTLAMEM